MLDRLKCLLFGHDLHGDIIESRETSFSIEIDGKKYDRVDTYKMRHCARCRVIIIP